MAKKSKTQRAKASAARQQRKADRDEVIEEIEETEAEDESDGKAKKAAASKDAAASKETKPVKKEEKKAPKKNNRMVQFFKDVRAEMKRVTWPTRIDVLRWSGVVVGALLFFGIFVAVLDNLIITPLLVFVSGL